MLSLKSARSVWGSAFLAAALGCSAAAQTGDDNVQLLTKGQELRAQGHYAEAQAIFASMLRNAQKSEPESQPASRLTAVVLENLAINEEAWGHYTQAETDFNQALGKFRGVTDDAIQIDLKTRLAELYMTEQRADDADAMLRQVIAALEQSPHLDHLALAVADEDLAVARLMQRKYREAETLLRQAMALEETEYGQDNPKEAGTLFTYAALLSSEHRGADAIVPAEHAWRILEGAKPSQSAAFHASALAVMSVVYFRAGRMAEAESYARHCVELAEPTLGPEHPRLALYLDNYANILKGMGRTKEAKNVQKNADAIRDQTPGGAGSASGGGGYTVNINALR